MNDIASDAKAVYRHLPHRDEWHLVQMITFRLADSLPREKLHQLEAELGKFVISEDERDQRRRTQIEAWLDAGTGSCALRQPEMARVMEEGFLRADGERYRLLAWCVMPNHAHVLIQQWAPLADIVRSWKAYSGRWASAHAAQLLPGRWGAGSAKASSKTSRTFRFWQPGYWDRFMRNERHFSATIEYIHYNPVKAGLCAKPENWLGSSARFFRDGASFWRSGEFL
jgi:type I restriction enzyme R subunit/putative DNA methylase